MSDDSLDDPYHPDAVPVERFLNDIGKKPKGRQRRKLMECPDCQEIFVDLESFVKHKLLMHYQPSEEPHPSDDLFHAVVKRDFSLAQRVFNEKPLIAPAYVACRLKLGPALARLLDDADFSRNVAKMLEEVSLYLGVPVQPPLIQGGDLFGGWTIESNARVDVIGLMVEEAWLAVSDSLPERGVLAGEMLGRTANWVASHSVAELRGEGRHVEDLAAAVILAQMKRILLLTAYQSLDLETTRKLVCAVAERQPTLVDYLVPGQLSWVAIRKVLVGLLRERVSILDLANILQILADHVEITKDADTLVEIVRAGLASTIARPLAHYAQLSVVVLSRELEAELLGALTDSDLGSTLVISPERGEEILFALEESLLGFKVSGTPEILLTVSSLRPSMSRLLRRSVPDLQVLSWNEIPPGISPAIVATIH